MEDGVYIGLAHADYLAAQGRLGSTDLTRLYSRGAGWWWTSRYNPHHMPKATEAQVFGTALHTLLLEGREVYTAQFAVRPNPRDYPELLTSSDEMRSALMASDGAGLVKSKTPRAELVQLCKAYLPDRHVWDAIVESWSRTARDKQHLDSGEAFALEAMYAAAMADEDMRVVCTAQGGVRLNELSVLYTDARGIRKRFRFDALLPSTNVDLKSIADWRAQPFEQSVARRVADEHLNVQLAMSYEARLAMYALLARGQVFCGPNAVHWTSQQSVDYSAQVRWLARFPAEAPLADVANHQPAWQWLWLFYQKAESGAAPSLLPLIVPWGDELHLNGWRKMRLAEDCYLANVKEFGLQRPWTQVRQAHTTSHKSARRIEIREWDAPMQQPGEEEAMQWLK